MDFTLINSRKIQLQETQFAALKVLIQFSINEFKKL